MKEINRRAAGVNTYGKYLGLTIGVVKNNADPMQHGRLQVYVPAYDAIDFEVQDLPWCSYVSPFGGVTANFVVGPEDKQLPGISAYGFWAIPKNSAQVLVGCIDGNPANRFWMGCIYQPEFNRTLPTGIDGVHSEIDDSGIYGSQLEFPHMQERLSEAGLWKGDTHFKTRGGYERSVSHPSNKNNNKPTDNGYAPKRLEKSKADSQAVTLTTPGHHSVTMSDVDVFGRVRIKSTNGQQVIFDDTNERIYISTGRGKNWIEMDETNGKIYIYSDSKINLRSKNDMNLFSDRNINICADKRVNIQSLERAVKIQAYRNIEMLSTHANIKVSASRDMYLKTFDGPRAPKIEFKEWCHIRPTIPTSLMRDIAEEAGSTTSKLFIDTVDGSDYRITKGYWKLTARDDANIKSRQDSVHVQAKINIDLKAGQDVNIEAGQTIDIKAGTEVNTSAPTLNRQASSINDEAPTINHAGFAKAYVYGAELLIGIVEEGVAVPGGAKAADSADSANEAEEAKKTEYEYVPDYMVRPDHESWIRDEDEPKCKTPRNKNWQG